MVQLLTSGFGMGRPRATHLDGHKRLYFRLLVGLIQGLSIYGLFRVTGFDEINGQWLLVWALLTLYAPPVWLAAIGQISLRSTLIWCAIVTAVIALLGLSSGLSGDQSSILLVLFICLPPALFCAHHLAVPAINNRSLIAPYEGYYETAWKAGIQLVLALMFLGVFWLILLMGSLLFDAIGIHLVQDIISAPSFYCIATPLFFALGVELSDVRESLTQGIRTVALTLLSWLLPLAVFIAAAFLIALPLAGMSELQSSLSPAGLMLAASAGLIVLLNTVYQDGAEHTSSSGVLRVTLRIGAVLLVPMTAFALWAVAVRIGQHGLTVQRIVAMTASIIGLLYALGYSLSLLIKPREGGWLPLFETTNIVVGLLTTLTLVTYSTPWLNPVHVARESQIARIQSGKLRPIDIPYSWLANSAGTHGRQTLEDLSKSQDPAIATRAKEALEGTYRETTPAAAPTVTMLPAGTAVPEGLLDAIKAATPYRCQADTPCLARLYDVDADGVEDVLIQNGSDLDVFGLNENGTWASKGRFSNRSHCAVDVVNAEAFTNGTVKAAPAAPVSPVTIGSAVLDFRPTGECPKPIINRGG